MAAPHGRPKRQRSRSPELVKRITVTRAPRLPGQNGPRGHIKIGTVTIACVLGQAGTTRAKREGDRATPAGTMRILYGFFRPDRMARPRCRIPLRATARDFGWCDDPGRPTYNRFCRLPTPAGHEELWRTDGLYDLVFVLDYNLRPRRAGRGSAIFLHCSKADERGLRPTLGCVALRASDLRRLLPQLCRHPLLVVR